MFRYCDLLPRYRGPGGLAILLCLLLAAALLRPAQAQTAATLDVGAVIHVTVAGEPDISSDYPVNTDGNIIMLYVNEVHVQGLTLAQAQDKIAKALAKYYVKPQVVVTLVKEGGLRVQVTGAVTNQLDTVARADAHLNDVLQLAIPSLDADLTAVSITHGLAGETKTHDTVNYLAFLNNKTSAGNPALRNGDVIYVPHKTAVPIEINLRGEVAKTGRTQVPAGATVYDAIQGVGGGLLLTADKSRIVVQHADSAAQLPFNYEVARQQPESRTDNPILLDGDTIIIPSLAAASTYTITGAVRNPKEYDLTTPSITLAEAIGRAGGLADRAKMKDITIIRSAAGGSKVLKLDASNADIQAKTQVLPGDNITIPQGRAPFSPEPMAVIGAIIGIVSILHR